MPQKALIGCSATSAVATASTTWFSPFNGQNPLQALNTTESDGLTNFRNGSCTLANLYLYAQTNARTTATAFTIRVNGADTSITVSTTASTTGKYSDLTHSAAVADTDQVTVSVVQGSGAGNLLVPGITASVETSGQISTLLLGFGTTTNTGLSFFSCQTSNSRQTSFAAAAQYLSQAGALSNMQTRVPVNTSAGWPVTSVINNVTGNATISVGAAATGLFEDTTHTDSTAANDGYAIQHNSCINTRSISLNAIKFNTSVIGTTEIAGGFISLTSGNTRYTTPWYAGSNTQAQNYNPMAIAGTFSKLGILITSNASAAGASAVLQGGSSGGSTLTQTVALGTGTGFLTDTTHTDAMSQGDLFNYMASGSSGTININEATMVFYDGSTANPAGGGLTTLGAGN